MTDLNIASSPLSSAPSNSQLPPNTSSQQVKQWRSSRELPFELAQHVQLYFEESMFMQAYRLLLSTITADASSQRGLITVPPPEHLALTATLAVHPSLTTRTTSTEKWEQSNSSMRLLRLLQNTAGPVNSHFTKAFVFTKYDYSAEQDEKSDLRLNHSFAQEDSIWNRADDFWAVVGWAMNCSCLPGMHSARWEFWQLWLDFMLGVLETDWKYHIDNDSPAESLLWQYIKFAPGGNVRVRRIVRAIFADGSTQSQNEFREVFRRELKEPREETDKTKKREAVDIDNEVYADYLVPDESDMSSDNEARAQKRVRTRAPSAKRAAARASNHFLQSDFDGSGSAPSRSPSSSSQRIPPHLGPPESIALRLRLIQLLAHIAAHPTLTQTHHRASFPDQPDLYTLFVEFIKPLPLPAFHPFTVFTRLDPFTHTILQLFLLQRLLDTSPPTAIIISLLSTRTLLQSDLETHYLPYAASKATSDANARVSACLEGLIRGLARAGRLRRSDALSDAVDKGIQLRAARAREKRGRGEDDDEAWSCLVESGRRIGATVARLKT